MKLEIDTVEKTIVIKETVTIKELLDLWDTDLFDEDWTIKSADTTYWYNSGNITTSGYLDPQPIIFGDTTTTQVNAKV